MSEVTCPYCEYEFELSHDGGLYYQEDHGVETECPKCDKTFLVYGSCSWSWEGHKADCLNGLPHQWSAWYKLWEDAKGHPDQMYARRRCESCEKEEIEWRSPNIQNVKPTNKELT